MAVNQCEEVSLSRTELWACSHVFMVQKNGGVNARAYISNTTTRSCFKMFCVQSAVFFVEGAEASRDGASLEEIAHQGLPLRLC